VPPNTLRIRLSRTLSAASPTVQDRPCPRMANEERGRTHRYVSAFSCPTLSGSVPLSDVPYMYLRMRRPLSCTQGHAHSMRCLHYLRPMAQLAVRVPPYSRAHSAATGIWLAGSAWVLVWLYPPPYSLVPFGTVRMSSIQESCYAGLHSTAHCVCTEKHSMDRGSACMHQRTRAGGM
jgi:hypothetical protein